MPLSKEKMRERKQLDRLFNVKPKPKDVKPNTDALRDTREGSNDRLNSTVPPVVKPKHDMCYLYPDGGMRLGDMSLVKPNQCTKFNIVIPK